jgi:hypothetical protein
MVSIRKKFSWIDSSHVLIRKGMVVRDAMIGNIVAGKGELQKTLKCDHSETESIFLRAVGIH